MTAPKLPQRTVVPGSLRVFTHPARQVTAPVRRHFARRYDRPGRLGAALFLFDALAAAVVLALAVVLGSFVLAPGAAAPVRLTVTASDAQVRAVDTVGFVVRYENRGKLPLADASLALALPETFRVTSLEAEGALDATVEPLTAHGVIPLGTIGPGGNGTVRVAGYVLTGDDQDISIDVSFTGTPGDRPPIQETARAAVRVSGTALGLSLPEMIGTARLSVAGSVRPIYAVNDSGNALDGLRLLIVDKDEGKNYLDIELSLPAHAAVLVGELETTGDWTVVVSDAQAKRVLQELGIGPTEEWNELRITRLEPVMGENEIEVGVEVVAEEHHIDGGSLRVFPEPWELVDSDALPADARIDGIRADTRFTLEPNDAFAQIVRIPLRAGVDPTLVTVRAIATGVGSGGRTGFASTERIGIQAAAPTLAAELRYYTQEGEQLGRGPLPPRVAEKTEYWVVVRAQPGVIARDTELRVGLGPHVTYAGKFSASVSGAPRQVGNELVWRPDVLAGEGAFTFAAALAFRPTADMVDAEAVIVRTVRLLGNDEAGAAAEAATGSLATDLPADARAAEKGTRVRPALE